MLFFLMFFVVELPYLVLLLIGFTVRYHKNNTFDELNHFPHVLVNLTAYSEGDLIELAIASLAEQDYKGDMTILVIVDGGSRHNKETVTAGYFMANKYKNLDIKVVDKSHRKGRVDSNNTGLDYCVKNDIEYMLILDADTSCSEKTVSSFVKMMIKNPKLSAISGSIKVRNLNSIVTKLTYIEYVLGIVLSRFGLDTVGYVNNCSGAFSFFKVSDIKKIGGWRTGTAEDLDLTLRMYIHKYKISHCDEAVAYTDSPETFMDLCKQRLTWSGDMIFLLQRYISYLTPKYLGLDVFLFIWYNLFVTVSLPFCVLIYTFLLFLSYPFINAILIIVIIYSMYLYMSCCLFLLYMKICEQKDISSDLIWCLILQPGYSWFLRINDIYAFLLEILFNNHLNSKMAMRFTHIRGDLEKSEKYFNLNN